MAEGEVSTRRIATPSRVVKFNQAVVRTYSKFPFAGRLAIRELYANFKSAPTTARRVRAYCYLVGTVAAMSVAHGAQAFMGVTAASYRISEVAAAPSAARIGLAALDCLYTAANVGAIHTQLSVSGRATRSLLRKTSVPAATVCPACAAKRKSTLGRDMAFTVAGQTAFFLTLGLAV